MAPKGVASKSWRLALDRVIEAIKDELLIPHDPNVVVPEDEKFMDAGVYFQTKYPMGPAKDRFYAQLGEFFASMGANVHSAIQACATGLYHRCYRYPQYGFSEFLGAWLFPDTS